MVSILMTSFNRENYIKDSIESILSQSYKNFELIIVDDASSDGTWEIIKVYAKSDSRIKHFQNKINLGDYPNRNKAISYAIGEYLMFLDSDDIMHPNVISNCISVMEKYPNSGFGISNRNLGINSYTKLSSKEVIHSHFFVKPILMCGPGGTIYRRNYFNILKSFPTKYGPANDMYHNLKAACYTNVIIFPFDFCFYRIHQYQERNNKLSYLYNNYNYLKDAVAELPLNLSIKEKRWIIKKNDRRFIANLIKHFYSTLDLHEIKIAVIRTNFKMRDVISGIFHF